MQSKYVADVGDFGKYGLLRRLTGLTDSETATPDLSLGICWHLVPDDCCRRDGRHVTYLNDTDQNRCLYRECAPLLWETLRGLIEGGNRCIHGIPRLSIFPATTTFYDAPLCYPFYASRIMREMLRDRWFEGSLRGTEGTDVVFVDPDNGLGPDLQKYRKTGPKYAYLDDLREFWDRGQSIVLYQHLGMGRPTAEYVEEHRATLRQIGVEPIALRFRRGTGCVFYILPQPRHEAQLRERVGRLVAGNSCWRINRHFEFVEVPHD